MIEVTIIEPFDIITVDNAIMDLIMSKKLAYIETSEWIVITFNLCLSQVLVE